MDPMEEFSVVFDGVKHVPSWWWPTIRVDGDNRLLSVVLRVR